MTLLCLSYYKELSEGKENISSNFPRLLPLSFLIQFLFLNRLHIFKSIKIVLSFFLIYFIYLFFGCVGSSLLRVGFLQLRRAGATLRCGARASHCGGFSRCEAWALGMWASVVVSRRLQSAGSVVVVHGLSCSVACGILPDQGSNPRPLHWQVDS